ncbi:hypothetical protein RUND412_006358 [Rhizina undulata]
MATNSSLPPDTLITAKVSINGSTRRFKLALKDLGAAVLPAKLRALLAIPADQEVVFERYSDSAAKYVILDTANPSVYKQLYRAAKAKLKLRLKVTPVIKEIAGPSTRNIVASLPPAYTSQASLAIQQNSSRELPIPLEQASPAPPEISAAKLDKVVSEAVHTFLNGEEYLTKLRETVREEIEKQTPPPAEAPVPEPFQAPEFNTSIAPLTIPIPCQSKLSLNQTADPAVFCSSLSKQLSPNCNYEIYCNSCAKYIQEAHYHCGVCHRGDYDLCRSCVDLGVHCESSEHWLIKRTLFEGALICSTTESIRPRAEKKLEPVNNRICNCCIANKPESSFVTCTVCEDYDLCFSCVAKSKHGHHPAHEFVPVDKDASLEPLSKALTPGRNVRHLAACNGCQEHIFGIRHKCLQCPDWDYCSKCVKSAPESHPGHRFVPIYEPLIPASRANTAEPGVKHYGIYCDGPLCAKDHARDWIMGNRFKCAICPDTDFCADCEASPLNKHNPTHPLIKFRTSVRSVHVTTTENDNSETTMGDLPVEPIFAKPSVPATSNAATQVQTVAEVKPIEEPAEPSMESSRVSSMSEGADLLQASYLEDTIPDGSTKIAGEKFIQTWYLSNSGTTNWPAGVRVNFVGGDYMFYRNNEEDIKATVTPFEVRPGEVAGFSVTLEAPMPANRHHISYWRLTAPDGKRFGHKLWCDINVVEAPEKNEDIEVVEQPNLEEAEDIKDEFEDVGEVALSNSESASQMIFPKLPVESPVASIENLPSPVNHRSISHSQTSHSLIPPSPSTIKTLALDDDNEEEEISSLGEVDVESFLTDEEYDVLDASDEEVFFESERGERN